MNESPNVLGKWACGSKCMTLAIAEQEIFHLLGGSASECQLDPLPIQS